MGVIIIDSKEEERAREGLGVTVTTTVCCHRCPEWLCWQVGGYLNCVLQCLQYLLCSPCGYATAGITPYLPVKCQSEHLGGSCYFFRF